MQFGGALERTTLGKGLLWFWDRALKNWLTKSLTALVGTAAATYFIPPLRTLAASLINAISEIFR